MDRSAKIVGKRRKVQGRCAGVKGSLLYQISHICLCDYVYSRAESLFIVAAISLTKGEKE
jgi:hypothetical protein